MDGEMEGILIFGSRSRVAVTGVIFGVGVDSGGSDI